MVIHPTPSTNAITKIEIATTGNATDFGDLVHFHINLWCKAFASSTRGFAAGGGFHCFSI